MANRIFRTEFQVRGYELDGYGHVNHSVYLQYAEYARWCMIEEAAGGAKYFQKHGVAPVVVRVEIDYREPSYLAEWIVVETQLIEYRTRVARMRQTMKKRDTGKVAAEEIVTFLVVDAQGKAVTLPPDFEKLFS